MPNLFLYARNAAVPSSSEYFPTNMRIVVGPHRMYAAQVF
jgi:hypothetical protein